MPTSESGTVTLGMMVARKLRRKTKTTSTTRSTLITSVSSTSATEARMVVLRSSATLMSMAGEMEWESVGKSAFTRSITWMMLAPGCRRTIMGMARWPSVQPATRTFSTLSNTSATSRSRTGPLSRHETMMSL